MNALGFILQLSKNIPAIYLLSTSSVTVTDYAMCRIVHGTTFYYIECSMSLCVTTRTKVAPEPAETAFLLNNYLIFKFLKPVQKAVCGKEC